MHVHGLESMKLSTFQDARSRFEAFATRDARADGCFIIAVKTTGIYCRPVCPARPPKRENIEFHDDVASARRAGYRACLRCKPDDAPAHARTAKMITQACRRLESEEVAPRVSELALVAGVSAGRFHRLFKLATGLSPKQYALARRVESFRTRLKKGEGVTSALYASGFNSSSRAYEAGQRLGAKPSEIKSGGASLELRMDVARCSLGFVGIATSAKGLCALAFGDSDAEARSAVRDRLPKAIMIDASAEDSNFLARIVELVDHPSMEIVLPLDIRGTAFQERVWQALRRIPAGQTQSYAEVARAIGSPKSHRAVANACGANRIAVAIPCHRVLASGGGIGGYAFGVKRKKLLLQKEGRK